MAKLFRRLGDLLRGGPKAAPTMVPPVHAAKPEEQPAASKVIAPSLIIARPAESPMLREPAVAKEPSVPREPPVPGL